MALRMKNSRSSSIGSARATNRESGSPERIGRSSQSSDERRIQKSSSPAQRSMCGVTEPGSAPTMRPSTSTAR